MGGISYVAHVSNGKSAITTKRKLEGVAKHNLRKYKSDECRKYYAAVRNGKSGEGCQKSIS